MNDIMEPEIKKQDLKEVMTSIVNYSNNELYKKSEAQLEDYWHFKWNDSFNEYWNCYEFFEALKMYGNFCRRWEEHHNGISCVVERVRDKYLIPKIKIFLGEIKND